MEPSNLALFWAGVIACAILLYVILDGLDLGVGVLFGTTKEEAHRVGMMGTIAPFWDGNETWLVVIGAGLGIYGRESGQGMVFEPERATPPSPWDDEPRRGMPSLRVVK